MYVVYKTNIFLIKINYFYFYYYYMIGLKEKLEKHVLLLYH